MFIPRNDEQIRVDVTPGLVAGTSYFRFDGAATPVGLPDFRGYDIVISELTGRGILVRGFDYSWNYITGEFELLQSGDLFQHLTWYHVHFQNPITQPIPVIPSALIDATYFIRNINIPNIDIAKISNAVTLERLNWFIMKYEPECLLKILGYSLYKAVLTENSTRITELIFGAEYVNSWGTTKKWEGLIQPTPKISLIANYIYYYFQEASATQTSGVNTNVPKGEASEAVSVGDKMIYAWQFFNRETAKMVDFLVNKNSVGTAVYPEFTQWTYRQTLLNSKSNNSPL